MTQQKIPRISYELFDEERRFAELPKQDERSSFERDRNRILHSFAFRRLAGKTQVLNHELGDFHRTRLTHSLEVAQIDKGLAIRCGADSDLIEAICLAHDLGHPPFWHAGEQVLQDMMKESGGFEQNAQSLRVVTNLEWEVVDGDDNRGLNLTRATLDGILKTLSTFD
ncbi:MAG: dNTP triphosphohydrolase [Dehalococcoidia bacterium]|nr:dNTP triphosphohydrolase [Dehalococcoidia bacterium]